MSTPHSINPHAGEKLDAWHSHEGEAPPQDNHGSINPGFIALVGFVGVILLLITMYALYKYFEVIVQDEVVLKRERWDARSEVVSAQAQWSAQLSSYSWADPQAGTVSLPIDRAMQVVATEYTAR